MWIAMITKLKIKKKSLETILYINLDDKKINKTLLSTFSTQKLN